MMKKFRQLGATVGLLLLMVLLLISVYTYVLYQNFSRNMLEAALMAGICSVGGDVMPLGTIPTPAVAYLTVLEQADAGIVISASHNPYEHNGIKVFNARGYKLSDESEARVEELILSGAPMDVKTHGEIGKRLHGMRQMKRDYIDHLISSIDCDLSGLRVLVD